MILTRRGKNAAAVPGQMARQILDRPFCHRHQWERNSICYAHALSTQRVEEPRELRMQIHFAFVVPGLSGLSFGLGGRSPSRSAAAARETGVRFWEGGKEASSSPVPGSCSTRQNFFPASILKIKKSRSRCPRRQQLPLLPLSSITALRSIGRLVALVSVCVVLYSACLVHFALRTGWVMWCAGPPP